MLIGVFLLTANLSGFNLMVHTKRTHTRTETIFDFKAKQKQGYKPTSKHRKKLDHGSKTLNPRETAAKLVISQSFRGRGQKDSAPFIWHWAQEDKVTFADPRNILLSISSMERRGVQKPIMNNSTKAEGCFSQIFKYRSQSLQRYSLKC